MNQLITWRVKVDIPFTIPSSEKLEVTFATEDIILFIGWDSVSMELKLLLIQPQLSMDFLNHFGQLKVEMLLLPIITLR